MKEAVSGRRATTASHDDDLASYDRVTGVLDQTRRSLCWSAGAGYATVERTELSDRDLETKA